MRAGVLTVIAALACATGARAQFDVRHQCRGWIPTEAAPETNTDIYAIASVDPDGPGPRAPMLLFGSRAWDGHRFQGMATGHADDIRAMVWADLAGQGNPVLFGASAPTEGYEHARVYWFTGTGWQSVSNDLDGWAGGTLINAMASFDPDGIGPLPAGLYAGGSFTSPGSYLMRWDGAAWTGVGSGALNAPVNTLCVFDPDGTGPQAPRLIVGGQFQNAGSASGDYVVQWTGSAWAPLGIGLNGVCTASAVFDPDGAGPLGPRLIVGGSFTLAGGRSVGYIAQWDGSSWSALGSGLNGPVDSIVVADPDGDGPLPARLIVSGDFTSAGGVAVEYNAQWNGSSWSALSPGLDGKVFGAVLHDPDGNGPAPAALALCGSFARVGVLDLGDPVAWNGTEWYGITDSLNDAARAVTLFDPDGAGPEPARPVAGGDFTRAGYVPCGYIAQRVGLQWQRIGTGVNGPVSALAVYKKALIAGGSFSTAGGVPASCIAKWDGVSWSPLGSGLDGEVTAMAVFDPDGPGPLQPRLAVGGNFGTAGGVSAPYIAVWNGSSWSGLGTGLNGPVNAIAAMDTDGSGPKGDTLFVAGDFTLAGGVAVDQWAQWTGTAWQSIAPAPGVAINALASFDFDGAGPGPGTLFAGGTLADGSGFVVEVAGDYWFMLGDSFDGPVRSLLCMDPDDSDYLDPVLVAGGEFTANGVDATPGIGFWDGEYWNYMEGGVDGAALALGIGFDHDGTGPATHPLLVAGDFTSAGRKPGDHFGEYSFTGEPTVPTPPRDTIGRRGASASFPIAAEGVMPVQYHWMKGSTLIGDGPTPSGSVVSGSTTATLTISGLSDADAGSYNCSLTSACGNSYSTPGVLTITCAADINLDGFVDGIDYDQFNNDFESTDPAQHARADYNQDGFVDGIDYDQFNNDFESGC